MNRRLFGVVPVAQELAASAGEHLRLTGRLPVRLLTDDESAKLKAVFGDRLTDPVY